MSQIPVSTDPSADQVRIREVLRRAAEVESPEAPVLTVYADLRPEAHGDDPGRRNELVVVRDRLREVRGAYEANTPAADSLASSTEAVRTGPPVR